jgi:hypothetical protein
MDFLRNRLIFAHCHAEKGDGILHGHHSCVAPAFSCSSSSLSFSLSLSLSLFLSLSLSLFSAFTNADDAQAKRGADDGKRYDQGLQK